MAIRLPWRHVPWRAWLVPVLGLSCSCLAAAAAGDRPDPTYRTNVAEVRISFSATDQNNHGVATLAAGDFAVVDQDIVVRDFRSFARSGWTKLDVAILVDASESVAPRFRREMANSLDLISGTAGVPQEHLSLFSFSGLQPTLVCAGECRSPDGERLAPTRTGGLTPLYDAVAFASDYLGQHGDPDAEKVLILFSDGEDTISRNSLNNAIQAALAADVHIDSIGLSDSDSSRGAVILQTLASATGGRYFPLRDGARRALDAILEDFHASYTISYRLPSRTSGFHALRILPTHSQNLQFRTRSGYFYPNQMR